MYDGETDLNNTPSTTAGRVILLKEDILQKLKCTTHEYISMCLCLVFLKPLQKPETFHLNY